MRPKYVPIARIEIPAIASVSGWVRTAKVVYISRGTPAWIVGIISDLITSK